MAIITVRANNNNNNNNNTGLDNEGGRQISRARYNNEITSILVRYYVAAAWNSGEKKYSTLRFDKARLYRTGFYTIYVAVVIFNGAENDGGTRRGTPFISRTTPGPTTSRTPTGLIFEKGERVLLTEQLVQKPPPENVP